MHSVDNEIVRELNEWLEDFTRENKNKVNRYKQRIF